MHGVVFGLEATACALLVLKLTSELMMYIRRQCNPKPSPAPTPVPAAPAKPFNGATHSACKPPSLAGFRMPWVVPLLRAFKSHLLNHGRNMLVFRLGERADDEAASDHAPVPTPDCHCCVAVGKYQQCGGAGGSCKGAQCKDAVWSGATCPAGFSCYRVSQWWRYATHPVYCLPSDTLVWCRHRLEWPSAHDTYSRSLLQS